MPGSRVDIRGLVSSVRTPIYFTCCASLHPDLFHLLCVPSSINNVFFGGEIAVFVSRPKFDFITAYRTFLGLYILCRR